MMGLEDHVDPTFAYLSLTCLAKYLVSYLWQGQRPSSVRLVGTVSRLQVFPGKSMRGIEVPVLECTHQGPKIVDQPVLDRTFMVVNKEWEFQSGKTVHVLTTINISIEGNSIVFQKDGFPPLKVPKYMKKQPSKVKDIKLFGQEGQGQDCGEEAAEWFSNVLQKTGCRLLYSGEDIGKRRCGTHRKMQFDIYRFNTPAPKEEDQVAFHDGFPYLLTSEASLTDLNGRLKRPITMDWFRSNIEVSGCEAFEEDNWREIWIGDNRFTNQIPCDRCVLTTVDPLTGQKDPDGEPLETLKTYRYIHPRIKPCFGVHLMLETHGGPIQIGDSVYALT